MMDVNVHVLLNFPFSNCFPSVGGSIRTFNVKVFSFFYSLRALIQMFELKIIPKKAEK